MKKIMRKYSLSFLGTGLFISMLGCASDSVTINVPLVYTSEVEALVLSAQTTSRLWYTFDGLRPTVIVQPAEAVPRTITDSETGQQAFTWETK